MLNGLRPQLQRHMLSTMVTLNPMVLVDTKVMLDILIKSDYMSIKYLNPNMVPTNTMVFRVTLGHNMCLCAVAFGPLAMLLTLAVTLNSDKLNPWL